MRDLMWSHMQWRHDTALLIKHKEILSEYAEIRLYKMFQLISRWNVLKVNIHYRHVVTVGARTKELLFWT